MRLKEARHRSLSRGQQTAVVPSSQSCDGSISSYKAPPRRHSSNDSDDDAGCEYSESFELGAAALLELSTPAQLSAVSNTSALTEVGGSASDGYHSSSAGSSAKE